MPRKTRVMIVDDQALTRQVVSRQLEALGFEVQPKASGEDAWQALSAAPDDVDVLLLDRCMPGMDGMAVMQSLRTEPRLRDLPVVMFTALDSEPEIAEGIRAGVFYYLTKPAPVDLLSSVVTGAAEHRRRNRWFHEQVRRRDEGLALMTEGSFRFRTLGEADRVAATLGAACPEVPDLALGLSELLINAVEHGNLRIDYGEKAALVAEQRWISEVETRLADPVLGARQVAVDFAQDPERVTVTIADQGGGFDWRRYLDIAPDRAFQPHGRGIAIARRLVFERLTFQDPGNVVTAEAIKRRC